MTNLIKRSKMRLTKEGKGIYKIPKKLTFPPLQMIIMLSTKRS
jgi:hypothetical protein